MDINEHNRGIQLNKDIWDKKPLLKKIYGDFYRLIKVNVLEDKNHPTVEIGSGSGKIKEYLPACLKTDLFPNPWIDQVENAYRLSFKDNSVSNIILLDVFHHLQYPGLALKEMKRVLIPGGRVIIFDPYISLFGAIIYGPLHPEPIAWFKKISWLPPEGWTPEKDIYYAAQWNTTKIFFHQNQYEKELSGWKIAERIRLSSLPYILSGGYSRPQIYPEKLYSLINFFGKILDFFPWLFATRALVVLEKTETEKPKTELSS
jgi:SAM-dependent methyltransferase